MIRVVALWAVFASALNLGAEATAKSNSTGTAVIKVGKGELHLRSDDGGVRVISSSIIDRDGFHAGDLVTQVAKTTVGTPEQIFSVLRGLHPGAVTSASVVRDARRISVPLNVAAFQRFMPPVPPTPPSLSKRRG